MMLAHDGDSVFQYEYPLYEITKIEALKRLLRPWRYRLHKTMGRSVIVRRGAWRAKNDTSRS